MQTIEQAFQEYKTNCIKSGGLSARMSKEQLFAIYATFLSGITWTISQVALYSNAPDNEFAQRFLSIEQELKANLDDMQRNHIKTS